MNFLSLVCVQVLVNTACCVLMLVAKLIQCIVFGPLRVSERQVSPDLKGRVLPSGSFFFFNYTGDIISNLQESCVITMKELIHS